MIIINQLDFDVADLNRQLRVEAKKSTGALVSFTGYVRDNAQSKQVEKIYIEHFPELTQKQIQQIIDQAIEKYNVQSACVYHRIGELSKDEKIVYVATLSEHRKNAFKAAEFIIDYLKIKATFWKKEYIQGQYHWVNQKDSDVQKYKEWT